MKIYLIAFLLVSSILYSQKKYSEDDINYVKETYTYYYKNTWKPFTGIIKSKDEQSLSIGKVKNGWIVYSEYYDLEGKLKNKSSHSEFKSNYDTINKNTLLKNLNQLDISEIKFQKVRVYYNKESNNSIPKRINGVVVNNNVKWFYKNGILVKIEKYFDEQFQHIKERISIFHSPLGNIAFENQEDVFHEYKKWDENGNLIATGVYKNEEYNSKE